MGRGKIKSEAGRRQSPPLSSVSASVPRPVPTTPRRQRLTDYTSSDVETASTNRGRRSGAPTVDSHMLQHQNAASSDAQDDDEGVILMEVRTRIKPPPEEDEPVPMNPGGQDDISRILKDIGRHLKSFNNTLGRLHALGIQHITNLPELVLVGDQSSGKSSLMSAIAHLNLPRSDGVCTRCPIHIRLSSSDQESCRISLQQDYAFAASGNEPITEADVTEDNPFPPWVKQPREIKEFKTISYRNEDEDRGIDSIENIVRWAQVAILNHNHPHEQFIPLGRSERNPDELDPALEEERLSAAERATEAKFSPNTVSLEIKGRGLPDLSFYDLPGVFRNARHERDQYLVKVVENLTREYISHSKAMILWAVPMNVDPETSSAFTIIRQLRAQDRTIGVMTKADLLPRAGHSQWLAMLEGTQHMVGLGYYITSRTPQQALSKQHAAEEAFFNRQLQGSVWPLEFEAFDDRCGVDCLVRFLSQKLGHEFSKSLPEVQQKLNSKLNNIKDHLSRLPERPQNPELEVRRSLMEFAAAVKARITGKPFINVWRPCSDRFKKDVLDLKPKFVVMPDGFKMDRPDASAAIDLTDAESVVTMTSSPSLSAKRRQTFDESFESQTPVTQRRRGANGVKLEDQGRSFTMPPPPVTPQTPRTRNVRQSSSKTLAMIRQKLDSARDPGKPGEIPYEVYESLSMDGIRLWNEPIKSFLQEITSLLQRELDRALDNAFSNLKKRLVFKECKRFIKEFVHSHRDVVLDRMMLVYRLESEKIYTTDYETFKRHYDTELQILKRSRHFFRWKAHINDTTRETVPDWGKMTVEAQNKERKKHLEEDAKLGDDPYKEEIDVASHARGYFLTAAMRFIDCIAMHVSSGLFPDIVQSVDFYLDERLGLINNSDPTIFERLMEEEKATSDKRIQLKNDLQKFERAIEEIRNLQETVMAADEQSDTPMAEGDEDSDIGDTLDGSA
ncbi:Interferon-induced GTP-binding protein Mx [Pleurostoma richardsiae]|uniref:Interferon-induced GTP-binding protein Mx n=1 Tax=Pleurostoma richardsiae TaxID=41990 RepID=A0AA38VEF8_9PEZI|nr:Interferon-induced GTP-binding protein Mx [Pleurostoma richardsiae]